MPARRAGWWMLAAALLFGAALVLFWPGIATYDTVAQYAQVRSGAFDDWHPPAMARLWALLAPLGPGAAPMLVVQLASYWSGLGLIAGGLARTRHPVRAAAVLLVGASPLFLGWQGVVLKDAQLVGAMTAAVGLNAWWRLAGQRLPAWAIGAIALLLGYAVLVRANAAFAVIPLVALLLPIAWTWRLVVVPIGIVAALSIGPAINHGPLGAEPSGVEKTQALYDLAGIAVRAPPGATPLDRARVAAIAQRRCVKPFFWDPLGDPDHCAMLVEPLRRLPTGELYAALARATLRHPLAYAAQRLAHLNATERWLVADRWPAATPPRHGETAAFAPLRAPVAVERWQTLAGVIARTPVGWPILWVAIGLALLPLVDARPAAGLAAALIGSALTLEASFAVISIASDLRYHLWPMIAVALALAMLARRPVPRATLVGGGVAIAIVVTGLLARALLPVPPQTYTGLLG